jgi:hypothetical protein
VGGGRRGGAPPPPDERLWDFVDELALLGLVQVGPGT